MKKRRKLQNPIRIITLLLGICLTLIYSIKYVKSDIRQVYMLCAFGLILVITLSTFAVLFFRYEALYGPKDFADENNFINLLKLRKEFKEKNRN